MQRALGLVLALLIAVPACVDAPQVDFVGPRVLRSTLEGARRVETPVAGEVVVDFSEPLDPATIHAASVVLVPWKAVGDCALTPICAEGICARGRCWVDPLSKSDRSAIDDGAFTEGVPVEIELDSGPAGPKSRLRVRPLRPLAGHTRHWLVVGAGVRDRGRAPLIDAEGEVAAWSESFVTAAAGSSGPELQLVSPAPGAEAVPTNLAHVELSVFPPLPMPQPGVSLTLEAEDGGPGARLIEAMTCPGWAPGTCVRMQLEEPLRPGLRYRPAGGSLHDRLGQPARLPSVEGETWFRSAPGPDLEAPDPLVEVGWRGRCLVATVLDGEALELELRVGDSTRRAALAPPWAELGLVVEGPAPSDVVAWELSARDLANNTLELAGEIAAGPSFDAALPRLAITELLANPFGPEPAAEFVELLALPGPSPVELAGLVLSDRDIGELREAWLAGEEPPGDALPELSLAAGELAVVVGESWAPRLGEDPAPPEQVKLAVVDGSLGEGGLANAGEPLTLWAPSPEGPVEITRYGNWLDTSSSADNGRSLVGDPGGCDLSTSWRPHPLGTSSPGRLP